MRTKKITLWEARDRQSVKYFTVRPVFHGGHEIYMIPNPHGKGKQVSSPNPLHQHKYRIIRNFKVETIHHGFP